MQDLGGGRTLVACPAMDGGSAWFTNRGDGLVDGGQGVLAAAECGQVTGLVVQRSGEVGQERVGAGAGQAVVGGDGLVDGGQGVLAAAGSRQPRAELV
jgi:hypothetical protein